MEVHLCKLFTHTHVCEFHINYICKFNVNFALVFVWRNDTNKQEENTLNFMKIIFQIKMLFIQSFDTGMFRQLYIICYGNPF